MYGLNENNGLAARCQTVFCQEHPGNWKASGLMWPAGWVLGGSGLAAFRTKKAFKSGGLPRACAPGVCTVLQRPLGPCFLPPLLDGKVRP